MERAGDETSSTEFIEEPDAMTSSKRDLSVREKILLLTVVILSVASLTLFITTIVFSQQTCSQRESVPSFHPASVFDFEVNAQHSMSKDAWNFVQDGATTRRTEQDNIQAFGRYRLKPKVLVDVSKVDTSVSVQREYFTLPVGLSGWPYMKWMYTDGDELAVRATNNMRTIMILSDEASSTLEHMSKMSSGNMWQEVHLYKNRETTKGFLERIEKAQKISAIVVSVNRPVLGISYNKKRGLINFPSDVPHLANFPSSKMADLVNPGQSWAELVWLRNLTSLPLIVKGILGAEDAKMAADAGADGIIVSNDGGRLLDGVSASLDALPEVVAALNQTEVEVYMEGGVRTGSDVIKAVLLGAKMVFVGRPMMWALHQSGYEGVEKLLQIYRDEITNTMQLIGAPNLNQLKSEMIMTSLPTGDVMKGRGEL